MHTTIQNSQSKDVSRASVSDPGLLEEHVSWAPRYESALLCLGGFNTVVFGKRLVVSFAERRGTFSFDDGTGFVRRSRRGVPRRCAVDWGETSNQPRQHTRAAPGLH